MANNGPMPEYLFRITVPTAGGNNQAVELSPVDAYTFLTHDFSSVNFPNNNDAILQPKIQVLHNDNFLVVLNEIPPLNRNITHNAMRIQSAMISQYKYLPSHSMFSDILRKLINKKEAILSNNILKSILLKKQRVKMYIILFQIEIIIRIGNHYHGIARIWC